jgi:CBS domain-containing protein/anti-sigma regulatory factor (Ser/Thr protein kinase)
MPHSPNHAIQMITDAEAGLITRVEELAYELKIEEVMTRDVQVVNPAMRMQDVLNIFREARISGAPVVDDSRLVGIISIEDLIRALRDAGRSELEATVSSYMSTKVVTIHAGDPIVEALKLFAQTKFGRLVVTKPDGQLAGILTKGDVTRGLLQALQHAYQTEEVRRYRASHLFEDIISDRTSLILRYHIKPRDFTQGGSASSYIKKALLRLGAHPQIARCCGIAIYEAEMNLVIHTTHGGEVRVEIEPHQILMETSDDGPGIEDIERAMRPGYSTAPPEIREMGFGAGMGLKNIQRCVNELTIESTPGKGTRLEMRIQLPPQDSFREEDYFRAGKGAA